VDSEKWPKKEKTSLRAVRGLTVAPEANEPFCSLSGHLKVSGWSLLHNPVASLRTTLHLLRRRYSESFNTQRDS
jgi:hypothetical protein